MKTYKLEKHNTAIQLVTFITWLSSEKNMLKNTVGIQKPHLILFVNWLLVLN